MNYACEWVKGAISAQTAEPPYPCEWVKENWGKSASQVDRPYSCASLKMIFENSNEPINPNP